MQGGGRGGLFGGCSPVLDPRPLAAIPTLTPALPGQIDGTLSICRLTVCWGRGRRGEAITDVMYIQTSHISYVNLWQKRWKTRERSDIHISFNKVPRAHTKIRLSKMHSSQFFSSPFLNVGFTFKLFWIGKKANFGGTFVKCGCGCFFLACEDFGNVWQFIPRLRFFFFFLSGD